MRRTWLIFAQTVTVSVAIVFVLSTFKPQWLPDPHGGGAPSGMAEAARRAAPSVLSISATRGEPSPAESAAQGAVPPGEDDDEGPGHWGMGSAVVVSSDGLLLTNHHVVQDAKSIEVQLPSGTQVSATLVGSDPDTDLALLRVPAKGLPAIRWGDDRRLAVGEAVLAIGNPFNVGQTVTGGIVSALKRNQLGLSTFENFIQTDAAINPGNSGGALVDARGQLLGINTAIYSRSGGSLGIGFAIPVSTARQVMDALVRDGQVLRGWIGVQTRELSPELVQALKLGVDEGVLVSAVVQDAPAAQAGIRPGDVIRKVGSQTVKNPLDLLNTVAALRPQDQVKVQLMRERQTLNLSVQVGKRPATVTQPPAEPD